MRMIIGVATLTIAAACGRSFEVASVKPGKPPAQSTMTSLPGGERFVARNMPLVWLISAAYNVPMRQISGLPQDLSNEGYDIEAKADHPVDKDAVAILRRSWRIGSNSKCGARRKN